jgi:hypothetical protein
MPTTKSIFLGADAPRVLSVPMIAAVLANRRKLPARNTPLRWIREQTKSGALRPVTRVLPHSKDHRPSVRPVKAERIEFRFHAMPARLLDEHAGEIEDRIDLDFKYLRATPEKALLDWIYLGASARTKIAGPPFDIDAVRLKKARLQRLAKAMSLESQLKTYLESKRKYDEDPELKRTTLWMRGSSAPPIVSPLLTISSIGCAVNLIMSIPNSSSVVKSPDWLIL